MSKCVECGSEPAENLRPYRDVTDTDRGDWVQEGYEHLCDECAREFFGDSEPDEPNEPNFSGSDRDEWKHKAAEWQRLK